MMRARFRIVSLRDIVSELPEVNESQNEITSAMLTTPSAEIPTPIQNRLSFSNFCTEEPPMFGQRHAVISHSRSQEGNALWADVIHVQIYTGPL